MHVDDIFAVGLKSRCDAFRNESNQMVPVKNLGGLRWYGGCHYTREREMGTLTISQKTFADELVKKFCVASTQSVPLRVGVKLEEFDEDEKVENWPFRELVGSLMWLSISTRPDIANAVRAVARYCTAPRAIHWKAALGIFEYINGTNEYGITFQRGTLSGISLEVFADADYASKATDRRSVYHVWRCMLVFQDSEMCYPFDFRSGVCCSRGRNEGVIVFETALAFHVTQ